MSQQQTNQMHRRHSNRPDTRFSHNSEYVTYQRIAADTLKSAQQLLADYPFAPRLKADVAYAHEVMADAAGCLGDEGGFLEHAEKAKNLRDALEKANPDDFQVRLCAIETTRLLAAGFSDAGQEKRATEMVEEALAALEVLADTPEKAERLAGSRALCLIVLSIPGVTEDPRFEGLTCKQVAIQVTA